MTNPDEQFYERAMERIRRATFALAVGGTLAALIWRGWAWGAGFAVGAAISWLNFRWLNHAVDALGGKRRLRARMAVLAGLRYLILGGMAYVILMFSKASVLAGLAGLFVSTAAVILEMLYQLAYARN
jgi:hypothetical protein